MSANERALLTNVEQIFGSRRSLERRWRRRRRHGRQNGRWRLRRRMRRQRPIAEATSLRLKVEDEAGRTKMLRPIAHGRNADRQAAKVGAGAGARIVDEIHIAIGVARLVGPRALRVLRAHNAKRAGQQPERQEAATSADYSVHSVVLVNSRIID